MRKNMIWKSLCLIPFFLTGCIDDKGNYDYNEVAELTISNVPELIEVLGYVENIKVSPKIVSSLEGEIKAGDPNYTVQYRLGYKGMGSLGGYDYENQQSIAFVDVTPESGFDLDIPANYLPESYVCWMTVTDNRTNVTTSKQFYINVSSTTSEGWLVLCNEGSEERTRVDMISQLTSTRIEAIHDVAKGMPETHHATCMSFVPKQSNPGDVIAVFTHEKDYELDKETLESDDSKDFNLNNFSIEPGETLFKEYTFAASSYAWLMKYRFGFAESGNAYCLVGGIAGEAYGLPINTSEPGMDVEFRVAPYCGYSWIRPWSGSYAANVLFYDIDNKRFVYFSGGSNFGSEYLCMFPIDNPEGALFSYTTGKDMVYMEGTSRNGLVCAILQDAAGNRSLYGINMGGTKPAQELYIDKVEAPDFEKATSFAFYSKGPLMYYAVGNKVYQYNYATKAYRQVTEVTLGADEEITQIKFNLYRTAVYSSLNKYGSDEFMNKQYQLVVSSYDNAASGTDNGKVSFYNIAQDGLDYTVSKDTEYTGFAKIVDVVYRERTN